MSICSKVVFLLPVLTGWLASCETYEPPRRSDIEPMVKTPKVSDLPPAPYDSDKAKEEPPKPVIVSKGVEETLQDIVEQSKPTTAREPGHHEEESRGPQPLRPALSPSQMAQVAAKAAKGAEGSTDCARFFDGLLRMRKALHGPKEVEALENQKETLLAACELLPPAMKQCLSPSFLASHSEECAKAGIRSTK